MSITEADNSLIADAHTILKRMITLADGELAFPEYESPGSDQRTVRVYKTAPNLVCVRYLIDRALGGVDVKLCEQMNSAHWKVYDMLCRILEKSDRQELSPDGINLATIKEIRAHVSDLRQREDLLTLKQSCEQIVIDFLPTVIERLAELCGGISVRQTRPRKQHKPEESEPELVHTDIQRKPDRQAIRYLLKRVSAARSLIEPVDESQLSRLQRPVSAPHEGPMPDWVKQILQDRERKEHQLNIPVAALFDPATGDAMYPERIQLPEHFPAAYRQLFAAAPIALEHLKQLAAGVETSIVADNGSRTIRVKHLPDPVAGLLLLNRIFGAVKLRLPLPWTSAYKPTNPAKHCADRAEQIIAKCGQQAAEAKQMLESLTTAITRIHTPICSAF
jgi:hypothetical protein